MITVTTFAELKKWATNFAEQERFYCMILKGNPGLLKTTTLKSAMPANAVWLSGALSPYQLFKECFFAIGKLIIIDDIIELFRNNEGIDLLKCLANNEILKHMYWSKRSPEMEKLKIAQKFTTDSRVCLIVNEFPKLSKLGSLESRGYVINFEPDAKEVHRAVSLDDLEVMKFIGEHLGKVLIPDIRVYRKAAEAKTWGLDWKSYILQEWNLSVEKWILDFKEIVAKAKNKEECQQLWLTMRGITIRQFHRDVKLLPSSPGGASVAAEYKKLPNAPRT